MLSRFFSGRRSSTSKKEVLDRSRIIEDVLFGQASSSDNDAIRAVAELVSSLCDNKTEAVVDAGVFVFFKIKGPNENFRVFTKRLTVRERAILNDTPTIIGDPYTLLKKLEDAKALDPAKTIELRTIAGRNDQNAQSKPHKELE